MRRVVDEFEDRVLIGEIYLPLERLVAYYGNDLSGAHLPFNFALLSAPWSAREIARIIDDYERALPLGAWPNWVLGNHDRPRVASRVGRGAGAGRRDAAADAARHADAVLRRRDRHASGGDRARPGARSVREERAGDRRRPRRLPHADAMGRDAACRLLHRRTLAAAGGRLSSTRTWTISTPTRDRSSACTGR